MPISTHDCPHTHVTTSTKPPRQTHPVSISYLLVQGFVVFEEGLEGFEDLHLAGDAGRGLGLSLHHRHPETALVAGHQALQMLQ